MEYHYPNDGNPKPLFVKLVTFCGVRPDGIDVPEGTAGLSEKVTQLPKGSRRKTLGVLVNISKLAKDIMQFCRDLAESGLVARFTGVGR